MYNPSVNLCVQIHPSVYAYQTKAEHRLSTQARNKKEAGAPEGNGEWTAREEKKRLPKLCGVSDSVLLPVKTFPSNLLPSPNPQLHPLHLSLGWVGVRDVAHDN